MTRANAAGEGGGWRSGPTGCPAESERRVRPTASEAPQTEPSGASRGAPPPLALTSRDGAHHTTRWVPLGGTKAPVLWEATRGPRRAASRTGLAPPGDP